MSALKITASASLIAVLSAGMAAANCNTSPDEHGEGFYVACGGSMAAVADQCSKSNWADGAEACKRG